MQKIGTFFVQASALIFQKVQTTLENIALDIAQIPSSEDSKVEQVSPVVDQIEKQKEQLKIQKAPVEEKVLQIDVIESGYLIKSQQELANSQNTPRQPQLHQKKKSQTNSQQGSHPMSRIKMIEQEKRLILQELKKLDEEIAEIRGQSVEDGTLKRREKQFQNQNANRQAKELVKQLKARKKSIEERKKKEAEKSLLMIKQQESEWKNKRAEQLQRVKEERRKAIQARMEEEKKKKEERRLIEKESNKLIKQLKKQEQVLKQREDLPQEVGQIEQKKKVIQKKKDVDFKQIEEHQRRYIQMKELAKQQKKQKSEAVSHSLPRYQKNMWLQLVEQQEVKRKEEQKIKELKRKETLQKRKKYGELVKNIFIPKPKKEAQEENQEFKEQKPSTPDVNLLPRIPDSQKRVTDSKPMKKFMEQNKPFATSHPKPPRPLQEKKEPEDLEKEKQRKAKEAEMRRITKERLKKLENRSLEVLPQSQSRPKYENYLGRIKAKPDNEATSWKKVIQNEQMSKEQKYKEMLRRAAAMENRAKVKEQVKKEGDEEAVNLYIGSIQAKLAILQKF